MLSHIANYSDNSEMRKRKLSHLAKFLLRSQFCQQNND